MIDDIKKDLFRCSGKSSFRFFISNLLFNPGFKFLFYFRLAQFYSRKTPLGLIFYLLYRRYTIKYGFQIPLRAKVGKGLALPHFGGIVINSGSVIGENCNILHGVTLGNIKTGVRAGAPVIGNSCFLGAYSVIVGNVKIGDGSIVVANSFVNIDVPPNSVVIGNPLKIKQKDFPSKPYLHNSIL